MIVHVVGRDFKLKNTMASDSAKYKIIDDRVTVEEFCTCEITVNYTGSFADLCAAGEYLYFPSRDQYSNFFQVMSIDVDYVAKVATLHGDNNLLLWLSQRADEGGEFGANLGAPQNVERYLHEFTTAPFPFEIKANDIASRMRAGDTTGTTAKDALNKIAELFDAEICFSYFMEDGTVKPYLEVYDARNGRETGETLTVGKELTALERSEDCSGVVTSVYIVGAVKASKRYDTTTEMADDESLEEDTYIIAANKPYFNTWFTSVSSLTQATNPATVYRYNNVFYYGKRSGTGHTALTTVKTNGAVAILLTSSAVHAYAGDEDYILTELPAYDDGENFVSTQKTRIVSRSAWSRFGVGELSVNLYGFGAEVAYNAGGVETTDPQDLLEQGLAILEANKQPVVTYDCECLKRVSYGAYYTLVVPEESVYLSARCLAIEESETAGTYKPTFGDFLAKENAFEIMARNVK